MLAVIITSVFKRRKALSLPGQAPQKSATCTGQPKLPLDNLESLRHQVNKLYGIQSYCMEYKYMKFFVATLDVHAATHHTAVATYKGMLRKSTSFAAHA